MFLVVLMYALFALTFPLAKLAMGLISSPLFFLSLRMLLAGCGMTLASFYVYPHRAELSLSDWALLFASGFFAIFVAFGCEFWAIQYVSSIKVNIFYSLSPFMTAFFAYFLEQERLSVKKILGLGAGFFGMLPLSWDFAEAQNVLLPTSVYDLGLLGSVASAAFAWLIIKRLMNRGFPLLFINGGMTLIGGMLCLVAYVTSSGLSVPAVISWPLLIVYMSGLVLISNVIGYTMYGSLLRRYSPTFLSFSGFMCPLFGLAYGYFFMHEPVSAPHILSLVCVFAGLVLFYTDERVQKSA